MKSLILCLSLCFAIGCATDDAWTPEPIDMESLDIPEGWSITEYGLILPPGYCPGPDGILLPCDPGEGGGQPGGGTGGGTGGGGGGSCSSSPLICFDWLCEYSTSDSFVRRSRTCQYTEYCSGGSTLQYVYQYDYSLGSCSPWGEPTPGAGG
jgi:hypothetical protein